VVAGVIEAELSPLMVYRERMKKANHTQACVWLCVCVYQLESNPCTLTFPPINVGGKLLIKDLQYLSI